MDINRVSFQNYLFSSGVVIDNNIFFFPDEENSLMIINMDNWQVSYFDKFSDCYGRFWGRADNVKAIGKNIFKLTLDGRFMEVLSIENGAYTKVPLNVGGRVWGNYAGFEVEKQHVYIIPRWERKVIQIDAVNFTKKEYNPTVKCSAKIPMKFVKFAAVHMEGNRIWLFEARNRQVDQLDTEKNIWAFYILPIDIGDWADVCWENGRFYILTENNCLYIWNPYVNCCELFWKDEKYCAITRYFGRILMIQQKIVVLLPNFGEDIVIVDICCGEGRCYDEYPKDFVYLDIKRGKYSWCFEDADYFYYPMWVSNYLMKVNKRNGEIGWQKLIMPLEEERFQMHVRSGQPLCDNLNRYLDLLRQSERKISQESGLGIGYGIWKKMKQV